MSISSPPAPEKLTSPSPTQIKCDYAHACTVDSSGVGKCWGFNDRYQLGDVLTPGKSTSVFFISFHVGTP
jgi:hypothetical protein